MKKSGFEKGHKFYGDLSKPNYFKKGMTPWNKGKKHTAESILKMKEAHKNRLPESSKQQGKTMKKRYKDGMVHPRGSLGKSPPNKGTKASDKLREKLRLSHLGQEAWNKGTGKGRVYYYYPSIFTNELFRKRIKTRDDYQCQYCHITEEEHIVVFGLNLSIHHIDYDKMNCSPLNLITVCHACNARANHNKDYWQEFFSGKVKEEVTSC